MIEAQQVVSPLAAMKQALEAWQTSVYGSDKHHKAMLLAMTKMNQAIAELEIQEPVAWADMGTRDVDNDAGLSWTTGHFHTTPLYTHPPQRTEQEQPLPPVEIGVDVTADSASVVAFYRRPNAVMEMFYSQFHPAPQRTWVGLTDEEIIDVIHPLVVADLSDEQTDYEIAKAIEAKLKQKNHVAQETN